MSLPEQSLMRWLVVALLLLAAWGASAQAQAGGEAAPSDGLSEAQKIAREEQKTVAAIQAAVDAGRYDEAIDLAKNFVRNAKSEDLKTQATGLVARAQRKKKNWDLAQATYLGLRSRYDKGSDEYIRVGAIVDILRASRDGLYFPLVVANGGTAEAPGAAASKILDDDEVLKEAMACLARNQTERLRVRVPRLLRARSVWEVVGQFLPLAEELHRLRVIWPDLNPSLEREVVQMAATRLAALSEQMLANMKEREAHFRAVQRGGRMNTAERSEMTRCQNTCEKMVAAETSFLKATAQLGGTAGWAEGQKLCDDSAQRRDAFMELAKTFTPPKRNTGATRGGGYNWRRDSRDGGAGF